MGTVQGEDEIVELTGVRKSQTQLDQHLEGTWRTQVTRLPNTWRKPRHPERPPLNAASSSAGGNPVELGPIEEGAAEVSSDESDTSIFGLRSVLHETVEVDELSEAMSQGSESEDESKPRAMAEKDRVSKWRQENFLLDDSDFAYVYNDFEEAYTHAGRAVAVTWSKARVLAEPELIMDLVRMEAVEATAAKIRRVDEQRKSVAAMKKEKASKPCLRQPGEGAEPEEGEGGKARFVEPIMQLMMDCRVGRAENPKATDVEVRNSLKRKAMKAIQTAGIPTLHIAITTAEEFRIYLEDKATGAGMAKVDSIALERFLCLSRAPVRAFKAVSWMCNNLQLGWPAVEGMRRGAKQVPVSGTECKRARVAQPGMFKALTEHMEAAAEAGDPVWLALLASWIQAMANLHLGLVLRNSVPVELYSGWLLCFCKRSRQKYEKVGFYWGVPSETSSGYSWAAKFLEEYDKRRGSESGESMMGMIFRTDTLEYLSVKEVKAATKRAMGETPWALMATTCSWGRLLPKVAQHINFSRNERFAVGDWKAASELGDEVPITLGHSKGGKGKSRTCKLTCAAVLSSLASKDINTFDEIPVQQWEAVARDAKSKVESAVPEVKTVWRNPDIAEAGRRGSKVESPPVAFPKQLAGIPLSPCSRDGNRYCADFQAGKCQVVASSVDGWSTPIGRCQAGLHRCAAVFRGGRTCHGNHPGAECRNIKRHAVLEGTNPKTQSR